ncbi:MAG: hypothetical protein ACFFAO_02755 [Candidatus Hermodarchaeota archaeon]
MITNRNLSKKKTESQNITISPYLKDWIKRYVKSEAQKNPRDKRFKSISSFYNYVLEKVMEIFKQGKTLDDLESYADIKVRQFYDAHSYKEFIPLADDAFESNRYNFDRFNSLIDAYQIYRNFIVKESKLMDTNLVNLAKRFENLFLRNNIVEKLNVKVKNGKFIVQYNGLYQNIHHEHVKNMIILAGVMGLKLENLNLYKGLENDAKLVFEKTPFYTEKDVSKKDIRYLVNQNLNKFINYYQMLNDNTYHLWCYLSKNKDITINFRNEFLGIEWISSFIDQLRNFATRNELKLSILRLFEHFHWITIKEEKRLSFKIDLCNNQFQEKEIMEKILQGIGTIENKNESYYLY